MLQTHFVVISIISHLLISNIVCHIFSTNLIKRNEDELLKGDVQDFALNQRFPISKDINYLLMRSVNSKIAFPPPPPLINKLPQALPQHHLPPMPPSASAPPPPSQPLPPLQITNRINLDPRPISTRPHRIFQAPPPRFEVPVEGNHISFSSNEDLPKAVTRDNGNEWPLPVPETPKIVHLDVKCEKNFMKVSVEFDKPFNGLIFSKGHYNYRNCIYLPPNTGRKNIFFEVSINACGTTGNAQGTFYNEDVAVDSGLFFENTVVVQYDPQVQGAWDQARKLRCTWHDQYEKAVSFRPFPVDMLDVVRADFAGDNVGCWMQIQVGKGPWASEVAGIVKIGQTMTMVLAIKDEENKFDMLVRNCIAHDSKRAPIELVDSSGCIMRPKLMTKFTKIKNFGSSASVLSYTHFQAFKFPDSMEVHFQCTIQICRYQCPEQCSSQSGAGEVINLYDENGSTEEIRKRRDVSEFIVEGKLTANKKEVGLEKAIQVVSPRDLSFTLNEESGQLPQVSPIDDQSICIATYNFILVIILMLLTCAGCVIVTLVFLRRKSVEPKSIDKQTSKHKSQDLYLNYMK